MLNNEFFYPENFYNTPHHLAKRSYPGVVDDFENCYRPGSSTQKLSSESETIQLQPTDR